MTKHSSRTGHWKGSTPTPVDPGFPPAQREGGACDLYAPGHQIHYTHQGSAVRSASRGTRDALLDDSLVTLVLDDGEIWHWRHHDPQRLGRILELLRGKCVVYPDFHAMRVGPYWFNCATEDDEWQDCRSPAAGRS